MKTGASYSDDCICWESIFISLTIYQLNYSILLHVLRTNNYIALSHKQLVIKKNLLQNLLPAFRSIHSGLLFNKVNLPQNHDCIDDKSKTLAE